MPRDLSIGRLAADTGTKVPTIRYYEQIGLMPVASRTEGNQRRYGEEQAERLRFIRHARALGFPLDVVRELLDLADDPDQPCASADAIARRRLADVEARLASLEALKVELERMIDHCQGGTVGQCHVVRVLADHSRCLAENHGPAA